MNKTLHKKPKIRADFTDKKAHSLFVHLDASGIERSEKLLEFVRWYALPRKLRRPETQEGLAEQIGIHKDTFANWKRRTGFWDEVAIYSNKYFRSHAPDVFYALVQHAKKTGDPSAVKLFAELFEGFGKKIEVRNTTPKMTYEPHELEAIRLAMKNVGLASLLEDEEADCPQSDSE